MSKKKITPSSDFTSKVMGDVKKRRRKIGLWNLAYFAPVALVLMLLILPPTQQSIINLASKKHAATIKAQRDVSKMQEIVGQLSQFELDEAQVFVDQTDILEYQSVDESVSDRQ